jgi:hypothetical protein
MRAGDLATKAPKENWKKMERKKGTPGKDINHCCFLWAAENFRKGKVGLSDPQDNDIFDRLAQMKMRKLDKRPEETPAEESVKEHQHGSPSDHHSQFQSPSSNRSNQSTSPAPDQSKNSKTDRIKSKKPSHGPSDAKFRGKEREKGRREAREGRKKKGKRKPSLSSYGHDDRS